MVQPAFRRILNACKAVLVTSVFCLNFSTANAMSNGAASPNTPENNSVVQIRNIYYGHRPAGGCTGTLISPDVVITAGHCVMGIDAPPDNNGVIMEHPISLYDGNWHPIPRGGTIEVRFGPNGMDPVEEITARQFRSPAMTETLGHADIAMIRLDQPVPASIAVPRPINTSLEDTPPGPLQIVGFGPECRTNQPRLRNSGMSSGQRTTAPNYYRGRFAGTTWACQGDSGAPAFRGRVLLGVLQQADIVRTTSPSRTFGIVKTFGRGGLFPRDNNILPDLAAWIQNTFWCVHRGAIMHTGDFDGDGRIDLLCHTSPSGIVDIDLASNGFGRTDWQSSRAFCTHDGAQFKVADINGDGRTDRVCATMTNGVITVNYAEGTGIFANRIWQSEPGWCYHSGAKVFLGDLNGDRRADRVCHTDGNGVVAINYATSNGRYANQTNWQSTNGFCFHRGAVFGLGDINNDRAADLICNTPATRSVRASYTRGGVPSMREDYATDPSTRRPVMPL